MHYWLLLGTLILDIQVTSLVDEDKDDTVCTLREAVQFLNYRGSSNAADVEKYAIGYQVVGIKTPHQILFCSVRTNIR